MDADYVHNLRIAADKIRSVAPNAKIIVSGALAVAHPWAPHMFCAVHLVPNAPAGIPVPPLHFVEKANEGRQRQAAHAIGAEFVDMCHASGKTMSVHPNERGSNFIADRLMPVA